MRRKEAINATRQHLGVNGIFWNVWMLNQTKVIQLYNNFNCQSDNITKFFKWILIPMFGNLVGDAVEFVINILIFSNLEVWD